jgi:hypothetical protein
MTVKASRPAPVQAQPDSHRAFWNFFSAPGQEPYALIMKTAGTWFRSGEVLQQAAHQALTAYQAAAQKPRAANTPAVLLGIQPELLSLYMEGPLQYWQQMATAGVQAQIEIMACINHLLTGQSAASLEMVPDNSKPALRASEKAFHDKADGLTAHALRPRASSKAMAE